MAIYDNGVTPYTLNVGEYFLNVEDIEEVPTSIKAYIPKIMPDVILGTSAITGVKHNINKSIFVNASDCAITGLDSLVNSQNYITIYPYPNETPNFHYKAVEENGKYIVKAHSTFLMEVQNNDLLNIHYTGKI